MSTLTNQKIRMKKLFLFKFLPAQVIFRMKCASGLGNNDYKRSINYSESFMGSLLPWSRVQWFNLMQCTAGASTTVSTKKQFNLSFGSFIRTVHIQALNILRCFRMRREMTCSIDTVSQGNWCLLI